MLLYAHEAVVLTEVRLMIVVQTVSYNSSYRKKSESQSSCNMLYLKENWAYIIIEYIFRYGVTRLPVITEI